MSCRKFIFFTFFSEYAPAGKSRRLEYVRLVNMVHIGKFKKNYIWEIVKTARKSFLLTNEDACEDAIHLSDVNIKHLINVIQSELNINSTSTVMDNVAGETLETAADLFVYLSFCPPQGIVRILFD